MEENKWEDQRLEAMMLQALALTCQGEKDPADQAADRSADTRLSRAASSVSLWIMASRCTLMVDYNWIEALRAIGPSATDYVDKTAGDLCDQSEAVPGSTTNNPQSELVEPLSQRELEVLQLDLPGPLKSRKSASACSSPWIRSKGTTAGFSKNCRYTGAPKPLPAPAS